MESERENVLRLNVSLVLMELYIILEKRSENDDLSG